VNRIRSNPFDSKLGMACNGMHSEETVKFICGYVMNIKFRKILLKPLENDVPYPIATAGWK